MKSIFSTQNLQTFFLRKYWRLPRRGPPGPPGPPPGPPSRRGPPCPPPGLACPPPAPCPPPRGPLGPDDCFCSSAIPACLSECCYRSFGSSGLKPVRFGDFSSGLKPRPPGEKSVLRKNANPQNPKHPPP